MKNYVLLFCLIFSSVVYTRYNTTQRCDDSRTCKAPCGASYQSGSAGNGRPSWNVQGFGLTTGGQQYPYIGVNANSYSYANGFNMVPK